MAGPDRLTADLLNDPAVDEFSALLKQADPAARSEFQGLLWQVAQMEKELKTTTAELAALRKELAEAREPKVKRMLTKAVKVLEQSVDAISSRIDSLQKAIIEGCQKAVSSVRAHGLSALANSARFFRVGPMLEAVGREAERAGARCGRALEDVHRQSKNYREAGRHLRNAGRALLGREPTAKAKGPGWLVRRLDSVYKREKAVFGHVQARAQNAAVCLRRFERAVARKPPIRATIESLNRKIVKDQKDRPTPTVEHDGR